MATEYAIYDMKDYEQLVFSGNMKEISKFLDYSEASLYSYITRKRKEQQELIKHRYDLVKIIDEKIEDVPKKTNSEIFQELLNLFKPSKVEFEIFDEFKWELKGLKDKVIINEEWKNIKGSAYYISNYGRIKNSITNNIKVPKFNKGILQINLCNKGTSKTFSIARLTAHYFIREIDKNERVRHIDGDIRNNYYKNLEIVSM